MREGKATWHWSFLLYAWIVKEKWGLGEKVEAK